MKQDCRNCSRNLNSSAPPTTAAEIERLREDAAQSRTGGPAPGHKDRGHKDGTHAPSPPMRIRATDDMPEDRIQASGEMPD